MADNTLQNGTSNIATDDIAGVHYQIVKVGHGLADAAPVHTSTTNPWPAVALQNSVVSTVNSAAAPLLLGATFVGTAEDVTEYSQIVVSVFASHNSAVDGLQLQQSHDNINWDFVDSYTIPAATGKTFSIAVLCKFFRVMYTNSGVIQTAFRMSTIYSKHVKKGSSVRPQDGRDNDNDFEETLAYQMSYDGTNWNRQRGTIANGLMTDVSRIVAALPAGANVVGGVTQSGTWNIGSITTLPSLVTGAAVIGALTANQSVNTAQIGGVATAVGSGVSGAGVQRVVMATDVPMPALSEMRSATLHVTGTAAANTALTVTLPAVAGLFHYITNIHLTRNATAALAGTATLIHTSTNLPGAPAWSVGNAMVAGGSQLDLNYTATTPLRSAVVNTATTITMPAAGAAVLNRINVSYFTAV